MSRGADVQSAQPESHTAENEPHDPSLPTSSGMRHARKVLAAMQAFVSSIYVHVVLVCFPLLYLRSMEDNTDLFSSRSRGFGGRSRIVGGGWANARTSSSRCQWTSFLDGVIHKGYATLAIAGSCLGFGGYVRQQSYEPMPMTLGLVLMIFSGDALLNTLAVLGYIHLVKTNVIAMRAQMNRLSHRALIRAAKLFAVPIAASLWCLAVTVVAAGFYFAQSGAPAMQVPPAYLHGSIARRSRDKPDHMADHDRALPYHEPVSIADHSLPTAGRVVVGVLTGLAVVRFFYVLYCLVRLHKSRGIGRHNRGDIESADMTNNLCAEGLSGIPLRRQAHADTDDAKKGPSEASSVPWTEGIMTGEPEEMAPICVGDHSSADDSCDLQANTTKLNRRPKRAKKQSSGSNGTVVGAWVRPVKSGKTRSSLHRDSKDKGNLDSAEVSGSSSSSAWTTESDSPETIAEEIGTATSTLVTS